MNTLASSRPNQPAQRPARAQARRQRPRLIAALLWGCLPALAAAASPAPLPVDLVAEVRQLAGDAAALLWPTAATAPRVEVVVGRLDPRLTLAPCEQIVPFLPPGARPLGATRIGLRCAKGETAWRVTLPMQVKLWAPALVARTTLPAGSVLQAQHLTLAEVDLAARADAAITLDRDAIGRTLQRSLSAGDTLRTGDLKVVVYFNAGDTVRVVAVGAGFSISGEGQALGAGSAGRQAQVRLTGGRVVTGIATGDRRVEVAL